MPRSINRTATGRSARIVVRSIRATCFKSPSAMTEASQMARTLGRLRRPRAHVGDDVVRATLALAAR